MSARMIVDVQNHVLPVSTIGEAVRVGIVDMSSTPPAIRYHGTSFASPPDFLDVQLHIRVCKEAGLTHVMLHQAMLATVANDVLGMTTVDASRMHNDFVALLRDQYPDLVFPYGTVKPHDGSSAVKEAERCVDELGFRALAVDTSYGVTDRAFLHTPETLEFWEFVNDREIPVYVHPSMLPYGWEWMDRFKFEETVGRPAETALCVSFMMMSGLFDRFPKLRIILAHMGGGLMMCLPRLQFAHRLGYEGMLEFQKPKNKLEPMEYVRENIWVDTMGFDAAGIKHAIEVFGLGHVLLGTDYGPIPISPREHIDIVCDELGLSVAEQDRILGLNAKELFDLPDPTG